MRPWFLLFVALLAMLAALLTWTRPSNPALMQRVPGQSTIAVQVLNNGFHTDLAIPRSALEAGRGPLADAARNLPAGDWILIGWGDAKFYVDQSPMEGRLLDGARAFFRPGNASVIMLDPAQTDPGRAYAPDQRRTLNLSPAAFDRLTDRIEGSFDLSSGAPRVTNQRPGDDVRFYASTETFSILHLCNHWLAEVLNAAGLPVRPVRSIASREIIATVDRVQPPVSQTP